MAPLGLSLLLALFIVSSCAAATCPDVCQCDSVTKKVACRTRGLTSIPANLPLDTVSLDLTDNAIAEVDTRSISAYEHLRSLDLSDNQVAEVRNDSFSATPALQRLVLRNNRLVSFDAYLPSSVVELDLSRNFIRVFKLPHHVETANLSSNVLTNLTGLFSSGSRATVLDLSSNNISSITAYAFKNVSKLMTLKLDSLPLLYHINHTAFRDLAELRRLQISGNPRLRFLHKDTFKYLSKLTRLDLSRNNITSFYSVAYEQLQSLKALDIHSNPLVCNCALKWVLAAGVRVLNAGATQCAQPEAFKGESLLNIPADDLICTQPRILNYTQEAYFKVGSQAVLKCLVEGDPEPMVQWTIPSGRTFTSNNYLEHQWDNRPSKESILDQIYHQNGEWQKVAHKYQDDLGPDRILLLSNGDLFISYVQRSDAGQYKCLAISPGGNDTETLRFLLNYTIIKDITVASMIVGFSSAGIFFGFGLLVALVRYIGNKCAERQVKKSRSIKKIIGHLDTYRSQQMERLKDNYGGHVGKMKEHALGQMDKMRENYLTQIARIQEKCASRMDHLRENYNTQMGRIKGYSTHQIEKVRENYNSQMIKIRDYGSTQLEKLRETYKMQHQHLMKILEAMNIDNCRGLVDDEAAKANRVLFETKFTLDNIADLNLDDLNLDHLDLDALDALDNLDNMSTSRMSLCISDDFETACSDPDGLSGSDPGDLQVVVARVHKQCKPEVHSESTQTREEDLAEETDVFVIHVEGEEKPTTRIGGLMSSSII